VLAQGAEGVAWIFIEYNGDKQIKSVNLEEQLFSLFLSSEQLFNRFFLFC